MQWLFDWLQNFVGWIFQTVKDAFTALIDLAHDAVLGIADAILDAIAAVIVAIPVPEFMQGGLGGMFSSLDPGVLYFVGALRIPEGLALIGAGVTFRLARKLLTLGQW